MTLFVNGQERPFAPLSVAALVDELTRSRAGTAVAINGDVVPRRDWEQVVVSDGDRVEVVTAVQGG